MGTAYTPCWLVLAPHARRGDSSTASCLSVSTEAKTKCGCHVPDGRTVDGSAALPCCVTVVSDTDELQVTLQRFAKIGSLPLEDSLVRVSIAGSLFARWSSTPHCATLVGWRFGVVGLHETRHRLLTRTHILLALSRTFAVCRRLLRFWPSTDFCVSTSHGWCACGRCELRPAGWRM